MAASVTSMPNVAPHMPDPHYRVGILLDSLVGGGAERMALNFAESLRALGHDAHVFLVANTIDTALAVLLIVYGVYSHVTMHKRDIYDHRTVLFADLKASMELLAGRDPEEARTLLDPVLERDVNDIAFERLGFGNHRRATHPRPRSLGTR